MKIFSQNIVSAADPYLRMDIRGITVNCPYWMNKLSGGKVKLRGFLNGKGKADEIKQELIRITGGEKKLTEGMIARISLRNRIGIDCSGFVYRIFENITQGQINSFFTDGINRTNVKTIISEKYSLKIRNLTDILPGDLISIMGRRHVMIIVSMENSKINYIHSSKMMTKIKGVHNVAIDILNPEQDLKTQKWNEVTVDGLPYPRFFMPDKGDGVFRLRYFL